MAQGKRAPHLEDEIFIDLTDLSDDYEDESEYLENLQERDKRKIKLNRRRAKARKALEDHFEKKRLHDLLDYLNEEE